MTIGKPATSIPFFFGHFPKQQTPPTHPTDLGTYRKLKAADKEVAVVQHFRGASGTSGGAGAGAAGASWAIEATLCNCTTL